MFAHNKLMNCLHKLSIRVSTVKPLLATKNLCESGTPDVYFTTVDRINISRWASFRDSPALASSGGALLCKTVLQILKLTIIKRCATTTTTTTTTTLFSTQMEDYTLFFIRTIL